MGIQGLMKLICDYSPSSIKDHAIKNYFGRKIAIDASMSLYQFLIAVRTDEGVLTSSDGETTSHLMGLFYRTIRMVENGIKPVYVFDGKPPDMKSGELVKRTEKRVEAQKSLAEAQENGDAESIERYQKRLVKVTPKHNEECKRLLTLMGIPYVDAPCEAEAQCAALVKKGKVFATATEDMDALTFGSSIVLRHLTASEQKKLPIREIHLDNLLDELGLTQTQFIDLCILLGCDYCESVKGVGPAKGLSLIRQYGTIEKIIANNPKLNFPEKWLYEEARQLFVTPEVTDAEGVELKWSKPDNSGILQFMVEEKGFSEDRIKNGVRKLEKHREGATQGRLDTFFKALPSPTAAAKRKADGQSMGPLKKKSKLSSSSHPKRR